MTDVGADVPLSRVDDDRQAPQDSATVSSDTLNYYRCSLQARVDIKRPTASGTYGSYQENKDPSSRLVLLFFRIHDSQFVMKLGFSPPFNDTHMSFYFPASNFDLLGINIPQINKRVMIIPPAPINP